MRRIPGLKAKSLLTVAGWMAWHEWTSAAARVPLAIVWTVSAPLTWFVLKWPAVNRWPLVEMALVLAMWVSALTWARPWQGRDLTVRL